MPNTNHPDSVELLSSSTANTASNRKTPTFSISSAATPSRTRSSSPKWTKSSPKRKSKSRPARRSSASNGFRICSRTFDRLFNRTHVSQRGLVPWEKSLPAVRKRLLGLAGCWALTLCVGRFCLRRGLMGAWRAGTSLRSLCRVPLLRCLEVYLV